MPGLGVVFGPPIEDASTQAPAHSPLVDALKKHEESLPPDLRADDLMNHDKVLNWSSPDGGEVQIPLAGEQDL